MKQANPPPTPPFCYSAEQIASNVPEPPIDSWALFKKAAALTALSSLKVWKQRYFGQLCLNTNYILN